ncbi:MAG: SIR2 family protein [Mycoplasmatales bacterium]
MYNDLIGKKINFLFGSGASMPFINTLDYSNGNTYEDILTKNENDDNKTLIILFYYYENIIKKSTLEEEFWKGDEIENYEKTLNNYINFLEKTIKLLHGFPQDSDKTVNIFTTNYDLFFEKSIDQILIDGDEVFDFLDGGNGNITRIFSLKNYDKKIYSTGIFGKIKNQIPTINLYKMHGSISWGKNNDERININYNKKSNKFKIFNEPIDNIYEALKETPNQENLQRFQDFYSKIAIVNPTKKKFMETVFQEAYYHIIRQMSYELEKENSILIVFGFSFADKHITEIIKRSLNNSSLKIFIYCYSQESKTNIEKKLPKRNQIEYIVPTDKGIIEFDNFIEKLFGNEKMGDKWMKLLKLVLSQE